ncbi:MAG: cytochrome C oxidase subunit IV family protein [Saprospiraceae bacterium]|nr:cytochrome C oxidase subunit IV family protein [Saprospiraceae bacterium]HMW39844.1 cytochrome C oxidase subunit IV family protein [Saprospiraceae bacterium]HMX88992.1 cytochrome C oxidase subunit IV family protein [Saprospiraceae bacterium]HMZ40839.1 cytochrome C oxidase subunit IV family protein [Saprospiraceae bacterium]HNA65206.1 cytochrome C oxidase subunit IV family protein [Saprospiraceae bacterium]
MSHLSYEESKKVVLRGLIILGIITLIEVFVALLGKGYIIHDFHLQKWLMYLLMISMSLYKAYFIVYYFMHMKYEVPGLVKSVLLPTLLLVWAVIAFFSEGKTWHDWRAKKNDRPIGIFENPPASHSESAGNTPHHSQEHNTQQPEDAKKELSPEEHPAEKH